MATGIQSTDSKLSYTVRLVEGALVANASPTVANLPPVAIPAADVGFAFSAISGGYALAPECSIWIYTTAGNGTMGIAPTRAWLYNSAAAKWFPPGTGTAATVGYLNEGVAYDESTADQISRVEVIYLPAHADGIYVQLGAITGTATAVNVDVRFTRSIVK